MTLVEKAGKMQITNVDHDTKEVKNLTHKDEGNQAKEQEQEEKKKLESLMYMSI